MVSTAAMDHAERRHPPGPHPLWEESWYFDFAAPDMGGFVRLGLLPNLGVSWYWGYLVRWAEPLLVARHHAAALPRGSVLELREDGLWAALYCETPHEHWTAGLEAFAVALDDPDDAFRGERGDRVPRGSTSSGRRPPASSAPMAWPAPVMPNPATSQARSWWGRNDWTSQAEVTESTGGASATGGAPAGCGPQGAWATAPSSTERLPLAVPRAPPRHSPSTDTWSPLRPG
ncbi:MAG: hypothetical protein M3P34_06425 [Actinomycetota bacterium]|nr:hypothetical protein [Actinomycetota bacterium]